MRDAVKRCCQNDSYLDLSHMSQLTYYTVSLFVDIYQQKHHSIEDYHSHELSENNDTKRRKKRKKEKSIQ